MSALDGSVVNTILPVLTATLHTKVSAVEWVITVYLLITSGLLLTAGRWADLRGHKNVYLLGYIIFVIGSFLCGVSHSVFELIACRAVQSIGATLLFATSPAIVTLNFPRERRGQALGLQATMTYLGIAVGPLLGGYLTTVFGWRSVFFINVPVGVAAFTLSYFQIPKMLPIAKAAKFDFVGAVLFFLGLTALLLPLDEAHEWGWLSVRTIGMLALSIALLAGFVRAELRTREPMIDLRLFRNRTFSASTVSSVLNFMSMSAMLFLMPYYLIAGRGFSPERAGMMLAFLPIPMAFVAPCSGLLSDKIGTRTPAVVGMTIMFVGCLLLAHLHAGSSLMYIAIGLAIAGVGTGIFISPNNSALMGAAKREEQGVASGVRSTARNVGNVLGVGMAGALYNNITAHSPGQTISFMVSHAVNIGMTATVITTGLAVASSALQSRE